MFWFFWSQGMWDLSSPTTCTPCIVKQSLNHWIARNVPKVTIIRKSDLINKT